MAGSVLIIDADPLFAAQAQASFEGAGLAVAVRDDASLDMIRRLRPSVLVVNVELPKGSGFSVCNRLRRDKELGLIPVLLTSSAPDGEAFRRHSTTAERADDYASKPLEQQDLLARVKRLLTLADERQVPSGSLESGGAEPPSMPPPPLPGPPPVPGLGGPPPVPGSMAPPPMPRPPPMPGKPPPIPVGGPGGTSASGGPPPLLRGEPAREPAPARELREGGPGPTRDGNLGNSARDLGVRDAADALLARDLAPPGLGRAAAPSSGATAPSGADLRSGAGVDEPWRAATFDDMLRERLTAAAPAALPKLASGDQREAFLRGYGKFLEAKEKAAREGWESVQEAAKDLDRRYQHARYELAQREARLGEQGQDLERTRLQLTAVETELKAFQSEITRIFQDKDAEERETQTRLSELEETNSALSRDLQEARKQNDDDRTRLKLFKSELDDFQTESDRLNAALQAANDRATRTEDALKTAERQIKSLEARLESAEALIAERDGELDEARERLEQQQIDASVEQEKSAEAHRAALEARESELQQQIAALEATELELRSEIDVLATERSTLEHDLARRSEEKQHLERVKAELTAALDEAETHAAEQQAALTHDIAELEQEKGGQAAVIAELSDARDELDRKLRETQDELLKEQASWATRESELNAEVDDREQELIKLEREQAEARQREEALGKELAAARAEIAAEKTGGRDQRASFETQVQELEEELEELRSNLFERMAELDAQRSNAQNLAQQVEATRAEAAAEKQRSSAIDAALRKVEASLDDKRREVAELSQKLLDAEAGKADAEEQALATMVELEDTQAKLDRADNFVLRAKEKILELQKKHDDSTADVRRDAEAQAAREREARREVEEQLNHVEDELSRRELEAAEATRGKMELEQQLAELTRKHALALAAKDTELADRAAELDDLRKQAFEAQAEVESQEGRILALIGDVETRERTSQGLRSELSHKEQKISSLGLDLVKARDQLRANAELSRERERRDVLLGRLMITLEGVQSVLATSPASVGRRSVSPEGAHEDPDTLGILPHAGADLPTRQLAPSWPDEGQAASWPGNAPPDGEVPSWSGHTTPGSEAQGWGGSTLPGAATFGVTAQPKAPPPGADPWAGTALPPIGGARVGLTTEPAPGTAVAPSPLASSSAEDEDESTSESALDDGLPSLRSPFPPDGARTSAPTPLVPKTPSKPDALTPSAPATGLFGALINEIQTEGTAQKASAKQAARRVSIEPPRAESRASKRRSRVTQPVNPPPSEHKPRTGGTIAHQLDEVAMLVDANLVDAGHGSSRVDPFRTGGAELPSPQVDVMLEELDRADAALDEDGEDVDEGQVTEIIRLDQLK